MGYKPRERGVGSLNVKTHLSKTIDLITLISTFLLLHHNYCIAKMIQLKYNDIPLRILVSLWGPLNAKNFPVEEGNV